MKFLKTNEIKPEVESKEHKKLRKTVLGLKISTAFFTLSFMSYGIYTFLTTYRFQSPVILQSPIIRIKQDVIVSPVATGSAKVTKVFNLGKIADTIFQLESSSGRNDGCRKMGLFNGYGFRQNTFEWVCYETQEEVRQLFINWLTNHIKDGDIEKALCMYNEGLVKSECTYSMNYQSLTNE